HRYIRRRACQSRRPRCPTRQESVAGLESSARGGGCIARDAAARWLVMRAASPAEKNSGVPIAIRNVAKIFGEDTDRPFRALKPISVSIAAGEFISVVGASGCGKSTLMLMVAGLLNRSTGEIRVGDEVVSGPITDVGIAFQDHLLLD